MPEKVRPKATVRLTSGEESSASVLGMTGEKLPTTSPTNNTMSTELSISTESQAFELVQRQAKLLSSSTLVPKEFQGNMANCAIGLNIAKRLGADPFMVLQNIDVIHGRPSFRATFLIAMVNASGRFAPLQFRLAGEGPTRACVAHTTALSTGEKVEGPEISMAMAKAEGWSTKNGSKWLTMPELMLRYRAAAFFARIYAPDITLGMQTAEELQDMPPMRNVTPDSPPAATSNPYAEKKKTEAPAEEKPAPKTRKKATKEEPAAETPAEPVEVIPSRKDMYAALKDACRDAEISPPTAEAKFRKAGLIPDGKTLADTSDAELFSIYKARLDILPPKVVPVAEDPEEDDGKDLMEGDQDS